jgi:hypothetical protein
MNVYEGMEIALTLGQGADGNKTIFQEQTTILT